MPQVSVVVPIYKVEKYLRQCVDSILGQTLTDIEVILVDDGSPDSCPAIVDEYAAADSRVIAIHQPNGGYGKAVNTGIARASAPYIGIIESDDWIEPTMYEKLYNRAQETGAQAVKCGHYSYNSTLAPEHQNTPWVFERINIYNAPDNAFIPTEWPDIFLFHTGPWSWLYKKELIQKIPFIESDGAAYQDIPFMYEMLAALPTIAVVKELLVHYREEDGSGSSSSVKGAGLMRMADTSSKAMQILEKYNLLSTVKEEFIFQVYNTHMGNIEKISPEFQQEYFDKVHRIFQHLHSLFDFSYKYFRKKHLKKVQLLTTGGDVSRLFRKWRFSLKKGRLQIRIAGIDICK